MYFQTYLNNFAAGEGFEAIGKQSSLYLPFSILVSRVCQKDCPDDDPLIAQIETDVMDKIQSELTRLVRYFNVYNIKRGNG